MRYWEGNMRIVLLVAAFITGITGAVGCEASGHGDDVQDQGPPLDPGSDGHELVSAPLDGMQSQGPNLLGARLDQVGQEPGYHANVINRATTADGQIVTVQFDGSADPFFTGMVL